MANKTVVAGQLKNSDFLECDALSGDWLSSASKEQHPSIVR
jgi:hypothetical protein